MKNNKFVMGTIILLIGSLLTKSLGFIIKIIYTRIIGSTGISLYSIITPTYSLLLTISMFSLPLSISKLVSENKTKTKNIFLSIYPVILLLNIITIVLVILISPFIADKLLHQPSTKIFLIAISLTLPFVSLSSLIKGYFFGKQRMSPYAISNVLEQIIRLILIIIILPKLMIINVNIAILGLILLTIISELSSIVIFMLFLPKKFTINKNDIKINLKIINDVLKVSIPSLSGKIIGNIGFFFEPIILTNILILVGYTNNFILLEYGVYNAYSISLLLMPSFFISAITTSLVPEISKYYINNNILMVKRRIKQSIYSSFIIGLLCNIFIFIFAPLLLKIIFNTSLGINYIRTLAPAFLLYYIESPISSALVAMNKAKSSMKITTYGVILKLIILSLTSLLKIGIYSLVISEIVNIIFVVILNIKVLKKTLYKMSI